MCANVNNLYFKLGLATLVSTIIGIIAGIIWPNFFTNITRLLLAELATAAVILIIIAVYLLFRQNNVLLQRESLTKYYLKFLIFACIGGVVITVISLSTTLTASLLSSVLVGISVGIFALILISSALTLNYLIDSNQQN